MAYTPVTEAERLANSWTAEQVEAENQRRREAERSSGGSWGIGDVMGLLFGGLLAAVGIGAAGTSGLFGPAIAAVFKSFINQMLPEEWRFDDGRPMEAFLRGLEPAQAQELLQGDAPFGLGLSEESARAISAEWTDVVDALQGAGVNLETIWQQGMDAILEPGVLNALVRNDALSVELKQTLFYEVLIQQNVSPELARELSNQTHALLQVVNDSTNGIDIEALLREGVDALSGQSLLAMLQTNPQVARLLEALTPEAQAAILQAAGQETMLEALGWLNQPSQVPSLSNMQVVMAAVERMGLSDEEVASFESVIGQLGNAFASNNPQDLRAAIQAVFTSPVLQRDDVLPELASALGQLSLRAGASPLVQDAQALLSNANNLSILRDVALTVGPGATDMITDIALGGEFDINRLVPLLTQENIRHLGALAQLDISSIRDAEVRKLAELSLATIGNIAHYQEVAGPDARLSDAEFQSIMSSITQITGAAPDADPATVRANTVDALTWLNQASQDPTMPNIQVLMRLVGSLDMPEADVAAFTALIGDAGQALSSGDSQQMKAAIQSLLTSPLLQSDSLLNGLSMALGELTLPELSAEQLAQLAASSGKTPEEIVQLMHDAQTLLANPRNLTILRDLTVAVGPDVSNAVIDLLMPTEGAEVDIAGLIPLITQNLDTLAPLTELDISAISDPQLRATAESTLANLGVILDFQEGVQLTDAEIQALVNNITPMLEGGEVEFRILAPQLKSIVDRNPEAWDQMINDLQLAPYMGEEGSQSLKAMLSANMINILGSGMNMFGALMGERSAPAPAAETPAETVEAQAAAAVEGVTIGGAAEVTEAAHFVLNATVAGGGAALPNTGR